MFLALGFGLAAGLGVAGGASAFASGIELGCDLSELNQTTWLVISPGAKQYVPEECELDALLVLYKEIQLLEDMSRGWGRVLEGYPNETPYTVFERAYKRTLRMAPLLAMMGKIPPEKED